jgi:hypothetical protein
LFSVGDRDRTAAPLGVVALFNRGKERVHIDKHDCARPDYGAGKAHFDVFRMT